MVPVVRFRLAACAVALASLATSAAVHAAEPVRLALGISGWTGFAPLTLADRAGIFARHGLAVDLKMIPQKDRHLALASDAIQCAATTVETHLAWNANGVPIVQLFQLDKSHGADGLAVRSDVTKFADLKGRTVAVDAPGTSPYFGLAWMLSKNGMSLKDVKTVTLAPQPAAQAFVAGQNDAAMTYEPYLSTVRGAPDKGHILATTLDYPMVMDTVGCTPKWLAAHREAAQALADSYFDALDMIRTEPQKANEIMGGAVKQSGEAFGKSASFLRWQDRAANREFFAGELKSFMQQSVPILLEAGVIRKAPADLDAMFDASFVR